MMMFLPMNFTWSFTCMVPRYGIRDHLQRNAPRRGAGTALADALYPSFSGANEVRYIFALAAPSGRATAADRCGRQDGVVLEVADLHAEAYWRRRGFQEPLDDVLAVLDLGLGDELREAADVRDKEQDFVGCRGVAMQSASRGPGSLSDLRHGVAAGRRHYIDPATPACVSTLPQRVASFLTKRSSSSGVPLPTGMNCRLLSCLVTRDRRSSR